MNNKFQVGDLVRVALSLGGPAARDRLGVIISKVPAVIIGDDALEYNVMFGNTITRWYGASLEKVESKESKK